MSILNIILIIIAIPSVLLTIGVLCCFIQSGQLSEQERQLEEFNKIDR